MRQTSFTLEVIPSTVYAGQAQVNVKTIDWDGTKWLDVKYHLEKTIVFEANDLDEEAIMFTAANLASRLSRMIMTELNERARKEQQQNLCSLPSSIRNTYARPVAMFLRIDENCPSSLSLGCWGFRIQAALKPARTTK